MSIASRFGFPMPLTVVSLAAAMAITACSSSGDDNGGGNVGGGGGGGGGGGTMVATADAELAAGEAIVGAIDSNEKAGTMLALTSPAVEAVATSAGIVIDDGSGGGGSSAASQIGVALGVVFHSVAGVRIDDTVTYTPNPADLCLNTLLAALSSQPTLADCEAFYSHITAELTIDSADDGTLAFMYDGNTALTIGYAPDTAYIELDLAEIRNVLEAFWQQVGTSNLPDTMAGRFRLTAESLGVDSGRITFSIEEAINLVDPTNEIDIQVAAAPAALVLTLDAPNNTASIELGLAGIDSILPFVDLSDVTHQTLVSLGGLSFLTALENDGANLVGTEIGLGDGGFTIDVVNDGGGDDPIDFSIMLPNFAFTVDGAAGTLTFDSLVDFAFAVDDRFGLFDPTYTPGTAHTFDLDIAAGTQLAPVGVDGVSGQAIFQVVAGSVSAVGTGDFIGGPATAVASDCFTLDLSVLFAPPGFPLGTVACPAP
jgi:hypothetical protein